MTSSSDVTGMTVGELQAVLEDGADVLVVP